MFTIKQVVRPADGIENDEIRLWEGSNVRLFNVPLPPDAPVPPNSVGSAGKFFIPTLGFDMPDGVWATIDTGTVYVMNAAGKTIDTFYLSGSAN